MTLQVITLSLMLAVISLLAVVLFIASTVTGVPGSASETLPDFLSLLHLALAGACYFAAVFLFARLVRPAPASGEEAPDPDAPLVRLRTACIVRLALMELPAVFGLVVCLIAAMQGMTNLQPLYWLNLGSAAVFLGFAVVTFPTRARIEYLLSSNTST